MSLQKEEKNYLSPREVARLLMVSTATIRLWASKGDIKAKVTAGGHRRFKIDDVKNFATKRNIQLNITSDNKVKILVVDDDVDFAKYLKILLELKIKNIEVEVSFDGFDAANKLIDFSPSILLLDLKMPNLNGFQVCKHVKENPLQQHIRVIVVSGDVNDNDIDEVTKLGAETCLAKPIDIPTLLKQLALS